MQLYADEDFPEGAVDELRRLGHDVLTVQEDNRRGEPDASMLARAHRLGRVVIIHNRKHFERLHRQGADHSGIVTATQDPHQEVSLAARIDAALGGMSRGRWCIRVNRPDRS